MKRLLLLFIPLVFFFGCEEDVSNSEQLCPTSPIQCGEISSAYTYPAFDGTVVPVFEPITGIMTLDTIGAHPAYVIITLINCYSGKVGTMCALSTDLPAANLDVYLCPYSQYQSDWIYNPADDTIGCYALQDDSGSPITFH
tara:strand:+ start:209 stop:631 length:423 start_codon:yes stop_codon:yes gene_type:complete